MSKGGGAGAHSELDGVVGEVGEARTATNRTGRRSGQREKTMTMAALQGALASFGLAKLTRRSWRSFQRGRGGLGIAVATEMAAVRSWPARPWGGTREGGEGESERGVQGVRGISRGFQGEAASRR